MEREITRRKELSQDLYLLFSAAETLKRRRNVTCRYLLCLWRWLHIWGELLERLVVGKRKNMNSGSSASQPSGSLVTKGDWMQIFGWTQDFSGQPVNMSKILYEMTMKREKLFYENWVQNTFTSRNSQSMDSNHNFCLVFWQTSVLTGFSLLTSL